MYEEEENADEDDELEDIIEEAQEEESENDSDNPLESGSSLKGKRKKRKEDTAQAKQLRELKTFQKEELKNLKTQILTMRDQINQKSYKIEEIKLNLKQSHMQMTGGMAQQSSITEGQGSNELLNDPNQTDGALNISK